VLVYSSAIPAAPSDFTLTVRGADLLLTGVTPDHYGDSHDATLTLPGAGFDTGTTVSLVGSDGVAHSATTVGIDLPTQVTAVFAAGSVPPGVYTVRATNSAGGTAELPGAFTIKAGGKAVLETHVVSPGILGYHIPATFYVEYKNAGDVAMPAPLIAFRVEQVITQPQRVLQVDNGQGVQYVDYKAGDIRSGALLTLDPTLVTQGFWTSAIPDGFSFVVQVLASGATPGVLQPGESGIVPVYYAGWQQPYDLHYPEFEPNLNVLQSDDTTPIDWNAMKDSLQPPSMPDDAWDAVFGNLTGALGNTWGSFVTALDAGAVYLSRLGEKVNDIGKLFGLQLNAALGPNPLPVLSSAVDARVPSPGLALTFSRSFSSSIPDRYALGPLGRGWSWTEGWDRTLQVRDDGTVIISAPGGSERIFQPDSRSSHYFSEPGDTGNLAATSGGFTLTEASGQVTAFGADGKIDDVQDRNGNKITAGYTGGLLTSLTHSDGQSLRIAYNTASRITSVADSAGRQTTFTYDATNEHLQSTTEFDGRVTHYTYATDHALTSVQNPDGTIDNFAYDTQGRLARTFMTSTGTPGMPMMPSTYTYISGGEVTVTDARGAITLYSSDDRGLLARLTDALGNATHYTYDNASHLTQITDAMGQVITLGYDRMGNLVRSTHPNGNTIVYGFSGPFDGLTSSTDPNGNTIHYQYDARSNLLSITYPDSSAQRFTYDPLGNLTDSTNRRGQTVHATYNSAGQVTREDFADGTHQDFAYDTSGNLVSAADASGTTTFDYDPSTERLTKVTYPGGRFLAFTYDAAGRRTRSVDQDNFMVIYIYDDTGMLAGLQDAAGKPIVSYTYDSVGRLARKDLGNGTYSTLDYDLAGNVLHLVNHAPDGSVSSRFDYTYDVLGLTRTLTTLDGEWTYQYDAEGRLTHAVFASTNTGVASQDLQYVYDAAGNRVQTVINGVTTQYSSNDLNQYTQVGSVAYRYDADGNLIAQTDAGGTTSYTYDELNHLTGVTSLGARRPISMIPWGSSQPRPPAARPPATSSTRRDSVALSGNTTIPAIWSLTTLTGWA
jgi:YD repeat-containing protein